MIPLKYHYLVLKKMYALYSLLQLVFSFLLVRVPKLIPVIVFNSGAIVFKVV